MPGPHLRDPVLLCDHFCTRLRRCDLEQAMAKPAAAENLRRQDKGLPRRNLDTLRSVRVTTAEPLPRLPVDSKWAA